MRLTVGATVAARELVTVSGERVSVPASGALVHLQFRRFAGCPVCNLHLRSFAHCHDELRAAGVREVVVFHAPADDLRRYTADLPFAVIPDPGKALYREFGVEASRRALLDPRAYATIARSIAHTLWEVLRHRRPAPPKSPYGGRWGLPADFLIAGDGRVVDVKYGAHAADHWPVGEVLRLALRGTAIAGPLRALH